jgi:hypothetical protein
MILDANCHVAALGVVLASDVLSGSIFLRIRT